MLQPKKTKYRRQQDGRFKGNAQRGNQLAFGSFGIKTLEAKWLTGRQLEAARVAVTRFMQREGQVWIRVFPDKAITRKPQQASEEEQQQNRRSRSAKLRIIEKL